MSFMYHFFETRCTHYTQYIKLGIRTVSQKWTPKQMSIMQPKIVFFYPKF